MRNQNIFSSLPPELAEWAHAALRDAHAPNTKSSYTSALLRFTQFCDKWNIAESDRMPTSYALLCAFIGDYKGTTGGGTIKTWMSGLRVWHDLNDAPWFGDHCWVKLAHVTANKEGTMHKRPLHAPVSIEHLLTLQRALDLALPFHTAVWAVATVSFFSCHRLGETTVEAASNFDAKYHVLQSTPYVSYHASCPATNTYLSVSFHTLGDGSKSASFHIPWTKTTKEMGANVILTARSDTLCPCSALHNHLTVNSTAPTNTSLFTYLHSDGSWCHMQKAQFLDFCTDIWSKVSLVHVLGHSFRIGGAVELLLAGVSPEIVATTGSWTSLTFLLYWRRMEEILPMSTSRAYNKAHINRLAEIFESFHIANNIPQHLTDVTDGDLEL